jgi:AcrR family transcriptional regulator
MSKKDPDRVRQNIINQAIKLFLAKGYASSTTNELVRLAGVSKGALYWHFKDKDDILNSILDKYESEFLEGLIARVNDCPGDFVAKFGTFYKFTTEFAYRNRELLLVFAALLLEFVGSQTEIEKRWRALDAKYAIILQRLLEDGIKVGTVGKEIDPLTYSRFMSGTLKGSLLMWYLHYEEYEADKVLSRRQAILQREALLKVVLSARSPLAEEGKP